MSTHYSLFMSWALQDELMVSVSISASLFCSGLVLGYALRSWSARRKLASLFRTFSRSSAKPHPTSAFGHPSRAF